MKLRLPNKGWLRRLLRRVRPVHVVTMTVCSDHRVEFTHGGLVLMRFVFVNRRGEVQSWDVGPLDTLDITFRDSVMKGYC